MRLLAVVAVLVLAGCAASASYPPSVGALGTMEPVGRYCLPRMGAHTFTVGWETVTNESDSPVTVDSVWLTDAENLTVTSARLVPILGTEGHRFLVGISRGLPRGDALTLYNTGTPVGEHPVIKPGEQMNVVLGVTTRGGQSGPAAVAYHDADGDRHVWVGGSDMLFPAGGLNACEKALGPLVTPVH